MYEQLSVPNYHSQIMLQKKGTDIILYTLCEVSPYIDGDFDRCKPLSDMVHYSS